MIAYMDTSILVKNYLEEAGSPEASRLWREVDTVIVSRVAYAEAICALHRKKRQGRLSDDVFTAACRAFRRDWYTLDHVEVSPDLDVVIDRVSARHPLRGFDVIHLASALMFRERTQDDFLFASADQRLRRAADAEGLQTFPET